MSIEQTTPDITSAGQLFCPHCNAASPLRATFCSSCGERLKRKKQAASLDEQDLKNRYRITTLVRRRPYVNLYFALDNQQTLSNGQPRMVAIREIDLSHLQKEARAEVIAQVQREYDQLRRWQIPHTLTSIDLRLFQGRLSLVSGLPVPAQESATSKQRLYTLQDFLQSGQGLPGEARTLEWMRSICVAVERLHRHRIILGDLDPYTILLNKNSVTADPHLMVFWLLPELQKLLPQFLHESSPQLSYFSAPEALTGKAEMRSDVYSLGALLYLLLTGTPPDESTLRHRRRLRSPHEINPRLSWHIDECIMQALAVEPEERFASVTALLTALQDTRARRVTRKLSIKNAPEVPSAPPGEEETVRIVPLSQKDVIRWRAAREEKEARDELASQQTHMLPTANLAPPLEASPQEGTASSRQTPQRGTPAAKGRGKSKAAFPPLPSTPHPDAEVSLPDLTGPKKKQADTSPPPTKANWKKRISSLLPVARTEEQQIESLTTQPVPSRGKRKKRSKSILVEKETTRSVVAQPADEKALVPLKSDQALVAQPADEKSIQTSEPAGEVQREEDVSLFKHFRRLFFGQQQHRIDAAAIIETPVRIRPDQPYSLRIHIMGRDEPTPHPLAHEGEPPAGLSALVHGEAASVEVRSVLQRGYTYVLQRVAITIPANGYAAEVTIPMQPQGGAATSVRNRLHIFFLDEQRKPLYEKPFVVEVYVSPHVQFGREGHQVLTIPM